MPVFLSASDETEGGPSGRFTHGGLVAPVTDWTSSFTPTWEESVINGPPKIDYFHMTDLRSRAWRAAHKITEADAERRIDAAVDVVCGMKTVFILTVSIEVAAYNEELGSLVAAHPACRTAPVQAMLKTPDYHGLLGYMLYSLVLVREWHPEVTTLGFLVERKKRLSHWFEQSHDDVPEMLHNVGHPELIPLLGPLQHFKKEDQRRPLEAADLLCWHRQRAHAGSVEGVDRERCARLFALEGRKVDVPREQFAVMASALLRDFPLGDDAIT